jgi:hypothetical protein
MCEARTSALFCGGGVFRKVRGKHLCYEHYHAYFQAQGVRFTPKRILQWAREKRRQEYLALMQLNEEYYGNR